LKWFYPDHEARHTKLRCDGQQKKYASLPPEDRFDGSLDGVPQEYIHPRCKTVTRMPEFIVRSYLVDPLTYVDSSFCCGCETHVDSAELYWIESNEKVIDYMGKLRASYLNERYGIVVPPSGSREVILTPRAIAKLQELVKSATMSPPYFVSLELKEDGSEQPFALNLAESWDTDRKEVLIENAGFPVLVPERQLQRLQGTVVDFRESGQGFQICRLYAPLSD